MTVSSRAAALAFALACSLSWSATWPATSQAQDYPSRPVKIVVPFGAGGPADVFSRVLAQHLSEALKQPFVVEDRPGAGSIIGTDAVAKSPPDGYTLLVMSNTHTTNESLIPNKPFQLMRDFVPVAPIYYSDLIMVMHPSVPAKNLKELIALAKAKPGQLNYGTPGSGTPHHLAMELMKQRAGLDIVHVPYKGAASSIADLLGGQVQMMFAPVPTLLPYARSGKLRFLAVTGEREAQAPAVPTFRELAMEYMDAVDSWYALCAPGKTPAALVQRLNQDLRAVMDTPEARETLLKLGLRPSVSSPEEFAEQVRSDLARWAKVVENGKITAD